VQAIAAHIDQLARRRMEALIAGSASPLVEGPYCCEHKEENDFYEKHIPKKTQSGA
jgi:hypothetical protein